MTKVVVCPSCGAVVREDDEEVLVEKVRSHALEQHELELTREQVLAMAHPA